MSKTPSEREKAQLRKEYLKALEEKEKLVSSLPHLYRYKDYKWSREFLESTNRMNFLTSGNQASKSTTQIRKCIRWATDKSLWPTLWRTEPRQFWYMYPSFPLATSEFFEKWIPDILPAGEAKAMGPYAWSHEMDGKSIRAIHFASGVSVYFKAYSQTADMLQASTVHAVFADEEMPVDLFHEIQFRLAAVDGHYHNVFTATLGQEMWRVTMEPGRSEKELFPDAFKRQVSLYDCMFFEDGSPGVWSQEKIERQKMMCKSENEIKKRIYGKFVSDEGLVYPSFSPDRNIKKAHVIPPTWYIYAGIDIGSGGQNHPAAITFVAVDPDYKEGRVFLGWRGDSRETTAGDVLDKYIEMKGKMTVQGAFYDFSSRDFGIISSSVTEIAPADKSHAKGEQILNVLFKNELLFLYDTEELFKLSSEFQSLKVGARKENAADDFIDSCRYACSSIPWDWEKIQNLIDTKTDMPQRVKTELDQRREWVVASDEFMRKEWNVEEEIDAWNELYDE